MSFCNGRLKPRQTELQSQKLLEHLPLLLQLQPQFNSNQLQDPSNNNLQEDFQTFRQHLHQQSDNSRDSVHQSNKLPLLFNLFKLFQDLNSNLSLLNNLSNKLLQLSTLILILEVFQQKLNLFIISMKNASFEKIRLITQRKITSFIQTDQQLKKIRNGLVCSQNIQFQFGLISLFLCSASYNNANMMKVPLLIFVEFLIIVVLRMNCV